MSVTTILASAQYRFGQDPSNSRFNDDFYNAINDAQNDIANTRRWGFLRTTATLTAVHAVRTVALPSDFAKFYSGAGNIRNTTSGHTGDIIELMSFEDWNNSHWEDGSTEGEPTYCYVQGTSLYLSPIPDAAYTFSIIYYKKPAEIVDSSAAITIPDQYSELLKTMVFRRLQVAGYSAVLEMQISDADIQKLMSKAAGSDIAEYGGLSMNLNGNEYTRRTV